MVRAAMSPMDGIAGHRGASLLACILVTGSALGAEQQMRDWKIKQANGGTLAGRLLELNDDHIVVEDRTGKRVRIPLWKLLGPDLVHLQRYKCNFPEALRASEAAGEGDPPAGEELLVDLSAEHLRAGALEEWENAGTLGGSFAALNDPPHVEEVAGRRAVTFEYGPWNLMMQFQTMVADFEAPECLTAAKPFTLAAWLYNPDTPRGIEAFLSSHKLTKGGRGVHFSYGGAGRYSKEKKARGGAYAGPLGRLDVPDEHFPAPNRWHHFAYVFTIGGGKGDLTLYVDGRAVAGTSFDGATGSKVAARPREPGMHLFLGSSWGKRWNWPRMAQDWYTGSIATLRLWNRALGKEEIRGLCGPSARKNQPQPTDEIRLTHIHEAPAGDYFTPEFDGLVAEPWPEELDKKHPEAKLMEGFGQPVITAYLDTPEKAMRNAIYSVERIMQKSPEVRQMFHVTRAAANMSNGERRWVSDEFVCACYGQARNMLSDLTFYGATNMLMHEMGHQFHIFGGSRLEIDFNLRLYEVFIDAMESCKWIGDYGANNRWEYIAVCANDWINDGGTFDTVHRRERLRRKDPKMFYFLKDYWSGDTVVELTPEYGLSVSPDGTVKSWANRGGSEYWGKFGWAKYRDTVGEFVARGTPERATVDGVSAVLFDGNDALVWNCRTKAMLAGNHEWSVELWARKSAAQLDATETSDETLLSFGDAQFHWGTTTRAYSLGRAGGGWPGPPDAGTWHHIAYVFAGGGIDDGAGELSLYVDGELEGRGRHRLSLAGGVPVVIGAVLDGNGIRNGFRGALAHVRVYDYDMSESQVRRHYREEKPKYRPAKLNTAGALYVDLDARELAPVPAGWNRPLYPGSMKRDWARSWFNRGTLAGKVYNDIREPDASRPAYGEIDGVQALAFDGNDRMVSIFTPDAETLASPPETLEAWVHGGDGSRKGTVLEWGGMRIPAKHVGRGWHHVAMLFEPRRTRLFVDGRARKAQRAMTAPGPNERLHLGAHWTGEAWEDHFDGALAQLRFHRDGLTPEEIAENAGVRPVSRPEAPAVRGSKVVDLDAERLAEGELEAWPNKGSAGGTFAPGGIGNAHAPFAQDVLGRRGVRFAQGKFLTSSFDIPRELQGNGPLTVRLRVHNIRGVFGTMLSWGWRRDGSAEFCFGNKHDPTAFRTGPKRRIKYDEDARPIAMWWNDIVYVYEPGEPSGNLKVYVNGLLYKEDRLDLVVGSGTKMNLGMAEYRGAAYVGLISELSVYGCALSYDEVRYLWQGNGKKPDAGRLLVDVSADGLPDGDVCEWPNRGGLGGGFTCKVDRDTTPVVREVHGRKAVVFDGKGDFLKSDVPTPHGVTGDRPFSIVVDYAATERRNATVFSLAPDEAQTAFFDIYDTGRAAEVRSSPGGNAAAFFAGNKSSDLGWKGGMPEVGKWHRVAYVYSGGRRGTFRVYVDGKLESSKAWSTFGTVAGHPMHIGASWTVGRGEANHYGGAVSRVIVYDRALSGPEAVR